jgi:hypothetical protein
MQFGEVSQIWKTIEAGDTVNKARSTNRAKVTNLLNGGKLLTDEEAEANNQEVNSNFCEAPVLFAHARRQMEGAFLPGDKFCSVTLPSAPKETATVWGAGITEELNAIMQDSLPYMEVIRSTVSSMLAHGPAPFIWIDQDDWLQKFISVDDLRIPLDTTLDMEAMSWFAVRQELTIGEIYNMALGEHADPRWNKPLIKKIIAKYKDDLFDTCTTETTDRSEEKMLSLFRQSGGYLSSDKAPTITVWNFYHKDGKRGKWFLKVTTTKEGIKGEKYEEFLYEDSEPVADKLNQILQVQYGDQSVDAPFKYHDVRSLGFLLFEPSYWSNQLLCKKIDFAFQAMNPLLRITDPVGKARPKVINLYAGGILENGVENVPANERQQAPLELIESLQSQLKQIQNETSTQYRPSLDTGTQKEQTAYEVAANLNMVNAMMTNILVVAFKRKRWEFKEICRRFCKKNSTNEDVGKFQKKCAARGIPVEWMDIERWRIEPDVPMGSGNPNMAISQANWLMQNRMAFGPAAQQLILHIVTSTMLKDARKASTLVPLDQKIEVTQSQINAVADFSALMRGHQVPVMEGSSTIEQVQILLRLLDEEIQMAEQDGKSTTRDVYGMHSVEKHIDGLIQQMAADPSRQEVAKGAADALGRLSNSIRAIEQQVSKQLQEQAQAQQDAQSQESQAKTAAIVGVAQAKVQTMKESAAAKMQAHAESTGMKDQMKMAQHQGDESRANDAMLAEQARLNATTEADISRNAVVAQAQVEQAKKLKPDKVE